MDICGRLMELAHNLYWTWHSGAVHIFHDLSPQLWEEENGNPIAILNRLSDEELVSRTQSLALESRITRTFHMLRDYLEDENTWGTRFARVLRAQPVAYFSAEFGLHESLPVYSGGLGVLAGDHLKAASDLGLRVLGVGLMYAKGYFKQSVDAEGQQQEDYVFSDLNALPLRQISGPDGKPLRIMVPLGSGGRVWVKAWSVDVGRCRLVLLDSNVHGNSDENRQLTAQLYGGDLSMRIRQEAVLGVGGLRMLRAMRVKPGVLHLNGGHSAFALLEQARVLMERDGKSFEEVYEMAAEQSVFTTHTPVEARYDRFPADLLLDTLSDLRDQLGISDRELLSTGRVDPRDDEEDYCMTVLGMKMARRRNAVSLLHSRVSRQCWHKLWPDSLQKNVPIDYITNGVHLASWLATELERLYNRVLGDDWQKKMHLHSTWQPARHIDDAELWELDQLLQARLLKFVRNRVATQVQRRGGQDDFSADQLFDENVLTIGFARRLAQYKRSTLLFQDLERLAQLVNSIEKPVQIIIAGKVHPTDDDSKAQIQEIFQVTKDERFANRVVFVEDYDINVARYLVQGVHVWLNTPRRPMEACGTSGMKAMVNGTLNLSVLDGWWAQAFDGSNGFAIGTGAEHLNKEVQDSIDHEALFEVLEQQVVPLFYERDANGLPRKWIQMQKNALCSLPWRFNSQRMLMQYAQGAYLPAVGGLDASLAVCPCGE